MKAVPKGSGPGSRKAKGGRLPPQAVVSAGSGPLAILGKPLRPRTDEGPGVSPLASQPLSVSDVVSCSLHFLTGLGPLCVGACPGTLRTSAK